MQDRANITFEIKKHLGIISRYDSGWTKELNIVSWNCQPPKYDIRDWNEDHDRMAKGLTFTENELSRLVGLYNAEKNRRIIEEAKREKEEKEKQNRQYYESRKQNAQESDNDENNSCGGDNGEDCPVCSAEGQIQEQAV